MANEYKCDAIVIYSSDFREYDKLLTLYTPTLGKKKVLLRGCKKPTAKLRFAGNPLFYGEFVILEGKGYDIVKTVESKKSFFNIPKDFDRYLDACNVLKIVNVNGEYNNFRLLFMLLLTYLSIIDEETTNTDVFTSKFFVEILRMQGFELNTKLCSTCSKCFGQNIYFDVDVNCFLCENCRKFSSMQVDKAVVELINVIQSNKFVELVNLDIDEKLIGKTKKFLNEIVNRHFF